MKKIIVLGLLSNTLFFMMGCSDQAQTIITNDVGLDNASDDFGLLDVEESGDNGDADLDADANNLVPICRYASTLKVEKNQCATPHLGPKWEVGPLNPALSELDLALEWKYESRCGYTTQFRDGIVHGDLVNVLAASGAIVSLNPLSGEEEHCAAFTSHGEGILLASPDSTKLISLTMAGVMEAEKAIRWLVFDPADSAAAVERSIPGCSFFGDDFRMTPDGQIIARTTFTEGLVSIDSLSGDVNWVVDDSELKAFIPPTYYQLALNSENMGFDKSTRELIIQLNSDVTVGIDSCGKIRLRDGIPATVVEFGSGHLELTRRRIRIVTADGQIQEDMQCLKVISLSEDTYACVNGGFNSRIALTIFEADKPKVEILSALPSPSYLDTIVASRDGLLLIPSERGLEFYDWRADVFVGFFEKPSGYTYLMEVRDVSADGRIIVVFGDNILALTSNLTGMAPGPYPRGFQGSRSGAAYPPAW